MTGFTAFTTASEFDKTYSQTSTPEILELTDNTLNIAFKNNATDVYERIELNDLRIGHDALYIPNQELNILAAENNAFEYAYNIESHGKDRSTARMYGKQVEPRLDFESGTINLNTYMKIGKGNKFRNQQIKHQLFIPEGGIVKFDYIPREYGWIVINRKKYLNYDLRNTEWSLKDGVFQQINIEENE